jgi:hypothetical protein
MTAIVAIARGCDGGFMIATVHFRDGSFSRWFILRKMSQTPYFCAFNSHIPYFLHYLILIYHTFQKYGISELNAQKYGI